MDIFESLENLNVSEECFNDIMGIVEEIINERNKENRQKKKDWEMKRTPEISPFYGDEKKFRLPKRESGIKGVKKHLRNENHVAADSAVDAIASGSRDDLGRTQNPVSFSQPSEFNKTHSKETRKEQSQRGSAKDENAYNDSSITHIRTQHKLKELGYK